MIRTFPDRSNLPRSTDAADAWCPYVQGAMKGRQKKISREEVERCARLYHTNKDAAAALGIRSDSFSALCRRDGLETPYKRRERR